MIVRMDRLLPAAVSRGGLGSRLSEADRRADRRTGASTATGRSGHVSIQQHAIRHVPVRTECQGAFTAVGTGRDGHLEVAFRPRIRDERGSCVPFTASIDSEGLLSWGMDPPRFEQVLAGQRYQSWRQWLTGRIAVYTLAAGEGGADVQSFVRSRIELDGIDSTTWSPNLAKTASVKRSRN